MDSLSYLANNARAAERAELAETLWRLPYSRLLNYGISSYREITDLDTIGIPVWVTHRPPATTISVTAGKNADRLLAFAGAITEAIEFWAAENPVEANFNTCSYQFIAERPDMTKACELLPFEAYPFARDNICDRNTPLPWEQVERIGPGPPYAWMPSNLIWLSERVSQQFQDVQQSSNGLASGTSRDDAILQGLYELVERDGWSIQQYCRELLGVPPKKIPLGDAPGPIAYLTGLMRSAGLYPMVFDCTTDLRIPVIGCALLGRDGVGLFGGYGCHANPQVAAARAILESAQSRLCYISGARDDLYRRDFILMKRVTSSALIKELEAMDSPWASWQAYADRLGTPIFSDTTEELTYIIGHLNDSDIDQLFCRTLATEPFGASTLFVVRVIAPQLEGVWCDAWRSNGRAVRELGRHASGEKDT